jgi:hypothetical protein
LLQRIAQSDRQGRQHPLPVEFQNQRLKAYSFWSVFGTPEQAAEKVASGQEPRPQSAAKAAFKTMQLSQR